MTSIVLATRIGCGGSFFRTWTKHVCGNWMEKVCVKDAPEQRAGREQTKNGADKRNQWIVIEFIKLCLLIRSLLDINSLYICFVVLADVLIWEGAIFNYLSSTTIVGRMGTWTVAAAACARHNLVRASCLPLLFALQMGHIFKNPEQIGSGLIFNPIIIYWRPPRIIILLSAPVRKK